MNELFKIEESLSPFEKWRRQYEVYTHNCPDVEEAGVPPWCAWFGCESPLDFEENRENFEMQDESFGYGYSEKEACMNMISKHSNLLRGWM